jgi:beta-lactamase regulating signal transducer with metallopeptidase domain
MSDYLLQFVAGNLLVSAALAGCAWTAQTRLRRPMVAHLLWTLALVKLLTPPLFTLPVVPLPAEAASPTADQLPVHVDAALPAMAEVEPLADAATWSLPGAGTLLVCAWLLGSAVVLCWSLTRVATFQRLLRRSRATTPPALSAQLAALSHRFGLRRAPDLHVTTARVTPMVWWLGGRVQVYLPVEMATQLPDDQLRWILAHELGHVRRGDHLVRWIEWLTCVAFWWNPVTWWARRNLRANEEVCCDALVMRTLQGSRHSYANSLLAAVEFLAMPGPRPPAMASEINSGGFLQKRFEMIVSKTPVKTVPRWLQGALAASAALLMPLGVAYAQNPDVEAVSERLERAVKAGELSKQDMRTMLGALKKSAAKQEQRGRDANRDRNQADELKERAEAMRRRLKAAIDSGSVDPSEARKILRERMAQLELEAAKRQEQLDREAADRQVERVRRRDRDESERRELIRRQRELQDRQRELEARTRELRERRDRDGRDERAAEYKKRLGAAIDNGRIDREQAARLWKEYAEKQQQQQQQKQKPQQQQDPRGAQARTDARDAYRAARAQYEDVRRQLEVAVKNGKLEREDMARKVEQMTDKIEAYRRKLAEVEKQRARAAKTDRGDRGEAVRRRLAAAVDRGDLSRQEARQKWLQLQSDKPVDKRATDRRAPQRDARADDARKQLQDLRAALDAAVERGDLSKQDAKKKWNALRKEMAAKKKAERKAQAEARKKSARQGGRDLKALEARIEAAVRRGDLSKEEAAQKWAAIKREMAAEDADRRSADRRRRRGGIR